MDRGLERNINNYYLYTMFSNLIIIGPVIMIYLLSKGLTFTEVMIINSISSISVVIFEVPTGAVSDKIGRKLSMIIGPLLWAISLSVYIMGRSFYVFAMAEIILFS